MLPRKMSTVRNICVALCCLGTKHELVKLCVHKHDQFNLSIDKSDNELLLYTMCTQVHFALETLHYTLLTLKYGVKISTCTRKSYLHAYTFVSAKVERV